MTPLAEWRSRLERLAGDAELARVAPGLSVGVAFASPSDRVAFAIRDGRIAPPGDAAAVTVEATDADWARTLADPAPPGFHAFTAWELANDAFAVAGDPQIRATARAALERVVEVALATAPLAAPAIGRDVSRIAGRLFDLPVGADRAEIHCDIVAEPGAEGPPIVFLHTAGADGRQFRAQLADPDLAARHPLYAPDLPFHGRSMPPAGWDGGPYRLTGATYLDWCTAILDGIVGRPAIVVGGSMGAAMALVLAAERPERLRGAVALEPPFRSAGRRSEWQDHVAVHAGLHNAAFVRGLMSPQSPEAARRDAAWIYAQGGPGVYRGDLAFYSEEFDGAAVGPRIDTARVPVALLSGRYDYSATPADGARLAAAIPGARHIVMEGLGHFPMIENPAALKPHLTAALDHVTAADEERP